jgi:hypothetical protein
VRPTLLLFSACARRPQSSLELVHGRGHRLIPRQRPGPSPTELGRRGIIEQTAGELGDPLTWLLSPISRRCCARTTRPEQSPSAKPCPAARSYKNIRSTSARTCSSPTARSRSPRQQQRDRRHRFPLALGAQRAPGGARAHRRAARARLALARWPGVGIPSRTRPRPRLNAPAGSVAIGGRYEPARLASSSSRPRRATATTSRREYPCRAWLSRVRRTQRHRTPARRPGASAARKSRSPTPGGDPAQRSSRLGGLLP